MIRDLPERSERMVLPVLRVLPVDQQAIQVQQVPWVPMVIRVPMEFKDPMVSRAPTEFKDRMAIKDRMVFRARMAIKGRMEIRELMVQRVGAGEDSGAVGAGPFTGGFELQTRDQVPGERPGEAVAGAV